MPNETFFMIFLADLSELQSDAKTTMNGIAKITIIALIPARIKCLHSVHINSLDKVLNGINNQWHDITVCSVLLMHCELNKLKLINEWISK